MCGIIGISSYQNVNLDLYNGLITLQHRGQDSAGMATYDKHFHIHKENGMVRDVFNPDVMLKLEGHVGIGHVRYPTAGCFSNEEAQPFYVNSPFGIVIAHNGNLVNTKKLSKEIYETDRRHLNTSSDTEVLLNVFAHELTHTGKEKLDSEAVFKAMEKVNERCSGGYSTVGIIAGLGMFAFRDPHGIRPLIFGQKKTTGGTEYIVASESVTLAILGYKIIRDVLPGECIVFPFHKKYEAKICAQKTEYSPCIFEFVYLARPDSVIDKISVYKSRLRMGKKLAKKILKEDPKHDIDVVIPVPDSSRTAALEVAYILGLKYREGLIKNRYIGRTFIMPGQEIRQRSIRQKLNVVPLEMKGKNVLLVDDSIVRGNTSKKIIEMCREAGAKKVYLASAAPKVIYPNVYGIDMPTSTELIARGLSNEEIAKIIGADKVYYQDLKDLIWAVQEGNPSITKFDASCFDGVYCTGDISAEYLQELESLRADSKKKLNESPLTLL